MDRKFDLLEHTSIADLRAHQLDRLKSSVAYAYEKVAHYRRAFDEAGLKPSDLVSFEDLARFPFTTKDHLRANYPFGMFAVPESDIVRLHASSGTTGQATVVGYTKADIKIWSNLVARSIRAAGGVPGDKVHVAYGYGLFTGGLGLHYGVEAMGCTVIPASGGFTERQVKLIADFGSNIIAVTPSYLLAIADEFDRQGISAREAGLRIAICGAEPWTDAMREEIETRMGLQAFDIYGLSEVIGPGVGQECADSRGALTLWEDHFYPEIIDPETGQVLPEGEEGELVFTSLTKEAMPIVRYRTRDLTRLLPPAGSRPMRRMDRIKGRSDDMLIIRGVNIFPTQIEAVLAQEPRLAPHYVLEVTRPGNLDELAVYVEWRPEAGASDAADNAPMARRVQGLIKGNTGVSAMVKIVDPGTLERSQGKAVRVIDKRGKA